ncbi:MAG: PAS domain-containing protein, partial [Bacteroidota bacterium]
SFKVHFFSGGINSLLKVPSGAQGLNILEMVPDAWKNPVKTGVRMAMESRTHHLISHLAIAGAETEDGVSDMKFDLKFRYLKKHFWPFPVVMIIWELVPAMVTNLREEMPDNIPDDSRLLLLEDRLSQAEEDLQVATEELDTANEEYQASHEELMASNEELQSTNEELQSLNEELFTVNSELQSKLKELSELSQDMNNLLSNSQIGTLFLDNQLIIRKFTGVAIELFDLLSTDVGRPITHFNPRLLNVDLISLFKEVIQTKAVQVRHVQSLDKSNYLIRLLPYQTHEGTNSGVICTILPIEFERLAIDNNIFSKYLLDLLGGDLANNTQALSSLIIVDAQLEDLPIIFVNASFERLTGYPMQEVKGRNCRFLQGPDTDPRTVDQIRKAVRDGESFEGTILNYRKNGTPFLNLLRIFPLKETNGTLMYFLGFQQEVPILNDYEKSGRLAIHADKLNKIPLPSLFVGTNQQILLCNNAWRNTYVGEDIFPLPLSEFDITFLPNDEEKAQMQETYTKGQSQFFSIKIRNNPATLQINPQFDEYNLLEGWIWTVYEEVS